MKPLFEMPKRGGRELDVNIARKANSGIKKSSTVIKGGGTLLGRINEIKALVEQNLGQFRDEYIVIDDETVLHDYLRKCTQNGIMALDTETMGLDPLLDKIVGVGIYTPGEPAAYIPINHTSYITGARAQNQLDEAVVAKHFNDGLKRRPEMTMFNAPFDIRVMRNMGAHSIYCTWDCYLAQRLLNENEPTNALKKLYQKYVLDGKEDAFSFDELFRGITFDKIPIKTGYLYAAHDPYVTHCLREYQSQFIYYDENKPYTDRNGLNGVSWVFFNIEMPCVIPMSDAEDNGVAFDFDKQKELSEKYNRLLVEKVQYFNSCCEKFASDIEKYRRNNVNSKLENPVNINSPVQIAILLYDVLKIKPPDKRKPRGTGEDILSQMNHPIAKAILDCRELSKLVGTYIDKLPECVNPNDKRIHCKFNQYGAKTGRMSSSDPNLQNIPSHNKDIRTMFKATDGYVLMSSDFSQQEPKCLAAMCRQAGDSQMYDSFMEGKDLYSEIASKAFNKSYEDCLEHFPKGSPIKKKNGKWYYGTSDDYDKLADGETDTYAEGKERRTQAKSVLLGVLYGRGEASIGKQLNVTTERAQAIKSSVFNGFPAIREFEQTSLNMAYELGYVTTVCGRKRRLPDLQLDEYEFKWKDGSPPHDDLLDFDSDDSDMEIPDAVINKYLRKLRNAWGREKRAIFEEANREGIWIVDNGGKIAEAERQCVNARIQGSAADLTKLAIIDLSKSERLKELGFRFLVPVHDEIIAECPEENVEECSKLLADIMSGAAEKILEMPIKCDVEITRCWYGESLDGGDIKTKESNTSHSMDIEKVRELRNENQ